MSLSKVQSIEDNYRRDSFDDRVCDDLSEVLLKYLSLKDRLRLECVSKQFQRTVYLSKSSLHLDVSKINVKDIESYKQLFQKYPNINEIIFDSSQLIGGKQINSDLIEMIIKYCNNLTHIQFKSFIYLKTEDKRKLFDRFSHQLICIDIRFSRVGFISNKAPNVEELIIRRCDTQLSQIEFRRLKRFGVKDLLEEDLDSLEVFIENNTKTLKYLDIDFIPISDEKSVERLLKIVSKAINLIHLGIDISFGLNDKSFDNYWKEIAINCKQIKSLRLNVEDYEKGINDGMLSIFKRLKRLDLQLIFGDFGSVDGFHPLQELNVLQGLTHLSIRFNPHIHETPVNETLLTDIDINFPKLKFLKIYSPFVASEWTAQVVSRISGLERVVLNIENKEFLPQIERQLTKNCKHFKNLFNLR